MNDQVSQPQPAKSQQSKVENLTPQLQTEDPSSVPKKKPILLIAVVLFIAVVGVGSYFLLQQLNQPKPITQQTTKAFETSGDFIPQPAPIQSPGGFGKLSQSSQLAEHYTGSQTITLTEISGGNSSGSVARNITQETSTHSIDVTLPDPQENSFYQAWIVKAENDYINIGRLIKNEQGVFALKSEYQLPIDTEDFNFEDMYNAVVVSQETQDDDVMETKILKGTFTE